MGLNTRSLQSVDHLQQLVSSIYDAALDESYWPQVIGQLARSFNADQGIMRVMNPKFDNVRQVYAHNKDAKWDRPYNQYYKNSDPWLKMVRPQDDYLACTHNVLSDREYKKLEFYADFISPQNIHYGMGGFLHAGNKKKCYLSFHRPYRGSGFESNFFQAFKSLVPHVKKSMLINELTSDMDFENSLLRDSLDQCNSPLLLVKKDAEILFMNSQAEALIRQQPGILIKRGFLTVLPNEANNELKRIIHQAVDRSAKTDFKRGGGMCFSDANKKISLSIMISPLNPGRINRDIPGDECALLSLNTNKPRGSFSVEMLISLYGFTPAEARLVEPLCQGLTLAQIADKFGLSKNTLRTQLRSCFRKTGVARQSDLINMVKTGPVGDFGLSD
jgi:DNA-binding CsgD family transcriptional regulator